MNPLFSKRIKFLKRALVVVSVLTVGAYLVRFFKHSFSTDPGNWGQFGDYIGGILNPLVSFTNVLVTYYVAEMVNEFSKGENNKQVSIQTKIIKSQLMYEAVNDFRVELNKHYEKMSDPTINLDLLKYFITQGIGVIDEFHQNYVHLFDENPAFHTRLVTDMSQAIQTITDQEGARQMVDRVGLLVALANSKNTLVSNLNKEIIRKLEQGAG